MKSQSLKQNQSGAAHLALIIVAVIVIVGGIAAYVLTKDSKKENNNSSSGNQQTTLPFVSKKASTTDEMKSMMTAARTGTYSVKCNYTDDSANASVIYIAKDNMRVDTTINKKPGHMIWHTDKAYIWADGDTKGSILPVTNSSSSSQQTDKFADSATKYKMSCETVSKLDDSLFKVPSNVTFTEFNSQVNSTSYSSN